MHTASNVLLILIIVQFLQPKAGDSSAARRHMADSAHYRVPGTW